MQKKKASRITKMSFNFQLTFLLLQVLILIAEAAADSSAQPYCYSNVTETSYKTVTKTRIKKVSSKNFFKKMVAKKDTQIEVYEEQEPVYKIKVERICCEGYKMTEYDLCEPQCLGSGCPPHSKCVEPEVCECLKGYLSARSLHNGQHYCQPICQEPCPEHSECVGPNQCACRKGYYNLDLRCVPHCINGCAFGGTCIAPNNCSCAVGYKSLQGACVATCTLGDQCQNGQCVAQDVCKCNPGYKWNIETFKCVPDEMPNSTLNPTFGQTEPAPTNFMLEVETDIESSSDDIDPNQMFDEYITTTDLDVTDEYGSTVQPHLAAEPPCPANYIFLKGKCLPPPKFASNNMDCRQKPCLDENAICLENGSCACKEGFIAFTTHLKDTATSTQNITTVCLLPAEHETRMQEYNEKQIETAESTGVTAIFFIVLGILILVVAVIVLGLKFLLRQTGEIDVEGKNMACVYDNRAHCDAEKSVI